MLIDQPRLWIVIWERYWTNLSCDLFEDKYHCFLWGTYENLYSNQAVPKTKVISVLPSMFLSGFSYELIFRTPRVLVWAFVCRNVIFQCYVYTLCAESVIITGNVDWRIGQQRRMNTISCWLDLLTACLHGMRTTLWTSELLRRVGTKAVTEFMQAISITTLTVCLGMFVLSWNIIKS